MFLTKTKRSRYYQIIYFKDGKQTSKSTHTANRKKAEIILEAFQRSVLELPGMPQASCSPRLKKFAGEYIELISLSCSRGYLIRSVKPAFKHLIFNFGNVELSGINSRDLERVLLDHYKKSKHSALLFHRVLKAAFNKAIDWEYIEKNPFKGFRLPKIQWKSPVFINIDELKLIIKQTEPQMFKDIFLFAFLTGMRSSEIMNLKWKQVDLKRGVIQIGSDEFQTKSKKIRFIPIAKAVINIFDRVYPGDIDLNKYCVFHKGDGYPFDSDYISRKFKCAVRKADISDDIHFHTLRASFGSFLLQNEVSLSVISKLLGHSSILVTERHYASLNFNNLISAINSFNEIYVQN